MRIAVHQALHGYSGGHRQISASVDLPTGDGRTVLTLSDTSGAGGRSEADGYLTGYPLTETGCYAIARSWPAPEMPRPGCVWTHTILIDFTDLAEVDDPGDLLKVFRRPSPDGLDRSYDHAIEIDVRHPARPSGVSSGPWLAEVVGALYGRPKDRIIARRPPKMDVDRLILAVWAQAWPRLRRSFRFCTLATSDRGLKGHPFDLQLLPTADRSSRLRFPGALDAAAVGDHGEWLNHALADLASPDGEGLRSSFRRLGADVPGNRAAFEPLCRFHEALGSSSFRAPRLEQAVALAGDDGPLGGALAVRSQLVSAAIRKSEEITPPVLDYIFAHLDLADHDLLATEGKRLGDAAWRISPSRFADLVSAQDIGPTIGHRTLETIDAGDLLAGLSREPRLERIAVEARPDLLLDTQFWERPTGDWTVAIEAASALDDPHAAVRAIVGAGRSDVAAGVVAALGSRVVLRTILADDAGPDWTHKGDAWLACSVRDVESVAAFLADTASEPLTRSALTHLARHLSPDGVPNAHGVDPWFTAWQTSILGERGSGDEFLGCFLLRRALGRVSRSPSELIVASFEVVHRAAAENRLPDQGWSLLDTVLPSSVFWPYWDRCLRIRSGVIDAFIERDLPTLAFASLADDPAVVEKLVSDARWRNHGRSFLRKVRKSLEQASGVPRESSTRLLDLLR